MKLKRGKKWLMHVGSKTFGERQLEIFEVGEMQFTFPTSRSKYCLMVISWCSCAYLVRYALRARRATKALAGVSQS